MSISLLSTRSSSVISKDGSVDEDYKGEKANYNHGEYCFSKEENKMYVCLLFEEYEYDNDHEPVNNVKEIYPYSKFKKFLSNLHCTLATPEHIPNPCINPHFIFDNFL